MRSSACLLAAAGFAAVSASPLWKRQSASLISASGTASATPVPLPSPIPAANATVPGRNNSRLWDWTADHMHGVSLGNWLVLERWMDEEWFIQSSGDSSAVDEWTWSQALGDRKTAVLQEHWDSWVTDDDIRFIAESGFDHIRIPVGYWAFISEPSGTPYASMAGQIEQMDRVLESAYNYGLYAIIDLHGLPGSQNGEQPSGRVGYNNFYQDQNMVLGDATVDAAIEWMTNSPHRSIISALAACNEPIYYGNDQYRALLGYYERTYTKLSALNPPIPMMFAPGKPDSDPFQLWQGFVNGKNPSLLVYEDHPYVGRNWGTSDQDYMLRQVCSRAERYRNYSVPVAVTEWSLSTDILNNPDWVARFWSTQLTAFPNPVFWSYRVNAYHNSNEQQTAENFTLYSFIDVARNGHIPLPEDGQTSQEYIESLDNYCGNTNEVRNFGTTVSSIRPAATQAFP